MRVSYREGESIILAEADELVINRNLLMIHFTSGKSIQRTFPTEEILNDFYEEVILKCGENPIRLENTNFSPSLGALLDDWDSMYDD